MLVVGFFTMEKELKLEASWDDVKELLKEVNYDLTDADLDYEPGETDQLLERLAKKLNRRPDEVRMIAKGGVPSLCTL